MSYVATTFTAGEQPSVAKWNQLTGNDAFFYALLVGSGVLTSTVLTNPYKFRVYRSAAFTDSSASFVKMNFDTKTFDTGSNFDNTTNYRFTAPVAGFYQFNAAISSTLTAANIGSVALYKNGAVDTVGSQFVQGAATASACRVVSSLIQLAATDYVEVYTYGSGGAGVVGASNTYFAGYFVSAT